MHSLTDVWEHMAASQSPDQAALVQAFAVEQLEPAPSGLPAVTIAAEEFTAVVTRLFVDCDTPPRAGKYRYAFNT